MTDTAAPPPAPSEATPPGNWWARLMDGETRYDFVGRRRIGYAISIVLLLVGVFSLPFQGLNLGIDFEGGVAWELPASGLSTDDVAEVVRAQGLEPERVQTLRGADGERIRAQVGPQAVELQEAVRSALAERAQLARDEVSLNSVGPTWGQEITDKAVRALLVSLALIALYLWIRLEWRMAVGAMVAVFHDVFVTVAIYSLFQFEVTPATVVALLTILGFSLYDTIVVFDKVHENTRRYGPTGRMTYGDIVNLSMNQVLMRSLNTSVAAVLPVLSLLIVGSLLMGAVALQDFALALFIGLVAGSYSSIFIATPLVATMKLREPRYRQLADRLGGEVTGAVPGPALGTGPGLPRPRSASSPARPVAPGPAAGTTVIPPRPRKQKRR